MFSNYHNDGVETDITPPSRVMAPLGHGIAKTQMDSYRRHIGFKSAI